MKMIRSDQILAGALGLLILTISCLWMLVERCPGCGPHGLRPLVVGVMTITALAGLSALLLTLWRTQRLWHWCHLGAVPHPPQLRQVCQRLGVAAEQVLCTAQPAPFSFCIGLLCPRIVVSTGLVAQVSTQELVAILAHEHHHQQRHDPLRLLVVMLVRVILYPLPAMHDFYRSFLALVEIEADETAVASSGRPALAAALYKLLTRSDPRTGAALPASVALFSAQQSRLERLLDPHQRPELPLSPARFALSLAPFLLLCLAMLFS